MGAGASDPTEVGLCPQQARGVSRVAPEANHPLHSSLCARVGLPRPVAWLFPPRPTLTSASSDPHVLGRLLTLE